MPCCTVVMTSSRVGTAMCSTMSQDCCTIHRWKPGYTSTIRYTRGGDSIRICTVHAPLQVGARGGACGGAMAGVGARGGGGFGGAGRGVVLTGGCWAGLAVG